MMPDGSIVAVGTGLAIVGSCSLPAAGSLFLQLTRKDKKEDRIYQDGDGKATPESVEAFSAKPAKLLILLLTAAGVALSTVIAFLSTKGDGSFVEDLLGMAGWILLLFQAVVIAASKKSVKAYDLGIYLFFSSLSLALVLLVQDMGLAQPLLHRNPLFFALRAADLGLAVLAAISGLLIPRRPDVFDRDGQLVDRMYTVSALNRFTWAWPHGILALARRKNDLDMVDLGRPNQYSRADAMSADWKRRDSKRRLWLALLLAHKEAFALQWVLTLGTSFLNFAPQYVILRFLRVLEEKEGTDSSYGVEVWQWVVWLGIAIVAQSWLENQVFWLSWAEMTIPARSQLSALIFEKAMRRKDVKGTGKSSNSPDAAAGSTSPDQSGEGKADEGELKKSKQSTVNLIGVDAKRVSDFCAFQNMFPGSLFKLIVSLAFLTNLLGWQALLAGFSAMLAIMPVNIYFSKRYSAAQDRLMESRDEKMGVVTEALQGIRQIKFSALEPEWEKKVNQVREKELANVWAVFLADTCLLFCWVTSPILLAAFSLSVYAAIHGSLSASTAFVSLGIFRALEVTLSVIPELTTDALDAYVSLKRIEEYLNSPEVAHVTKHAPEVTFESASIAWPADADIEDSERFVLRNVDVTFPQGELSVIYGKTGSGKSLLLSAILGEVDVLSGDLYVPKPPSLEARHDGQANKSNWILPGSIAYVCQIPWIENASIKDNILFGLPYDEDRYHETLRVCALLRDIDSFSDGENTEIGANGINLSGGQKWRITLARAMYSRAEILVLDDIFSAVDAHVGRHIFENCLNGELAKGRTRILVTHHVALCESKTKYLVQLGDGGVLHAGLLSELQEDGTLERIKSHEASQQEIEADEISTAVNSDDSTDEGDAENDADGNTLKKVTSKTTPRKFVEDEKREKGAVQKHIYYAYLKDSGGWGFWLVALGIFSLNQVLNVGRSWWLKIWTGDQVAQQATDMHVFNHSGEHGLAYAFGVQHTSVHSASGPSMQGHHDVKYYLQVYILLALTSAVIGTMKFYYMYLGSFSASRKLFAKLNYVVLRAPLRWLDTVPVGRILNRFTSDFHVIDSQLANSLSFCTNSFLNLAGVLVAGFLVSPYIVLLSLVLLLICLYYGSLYLDGAMPSRRLESNNKSPVFEQFGSALSGVSTIRGFDKVPTYLDRMYKKIDNWTVSTWHLWLFNRWMGWRMSLVGSFFASFVAILILVIPGILDVGGSALAGFGMAFALEFSNAVMWAIRLWAQVALHLNSVERCVEYTELPTESQEGASPPAAWPTRGIIEVDDLEVGYAPDLPPVLKGLTFSVNSNERVGVIGRTGAGKSSLTLALFRFLEARSGSIHVDGLDISKIKLHDLRSRLAIIPQDPVLFSGTIRSNLDPFDNHTDAALRDCLERVHLITSGSASTSGTATPIAAAGPTDPSSGENANVFKDLLSPVSEGGLNLSQGQRQLLCLARAIVSRPRVMVLDEATSAVDMHTDALIQRSIREEFTDATLLVIAHRLSTIADFDRILVLSDGRVAEFGSPKELWEMGAEGIFRSMCEESGETEKLRGIIYGKEGE